MELILFAVAILLLAAIAVYLYLGYAVADFSSKRRPTIDYRIKEQTKKTGIEKLSDAVIACDNFVNSHITECVTIAASDGIRLSAVWLKNPNEKAAAVIMHGFGSTYYNDFPFVLKRLYDMGFSLLLPDQRAHGKSEGKRICFGAKEHGDLLNWIRKTSELAEKDAPILACGLSMGASSVMFAMNKAAGTSLRAAVVDCGFTSPADIMAYRMKKHYPAPRLLLPAVALWTKLLCGYNIYAYSAEKSLKETNIPILFFHGTADKMVPIWMTKSAYSACASEKDCVYVEGARHGMSFAADEKSCGDKLESFIKKYIFGGKI